MNEMSIKSLIEAIDSGEYIYLKYKCMLSFIFIFEKKIITTIEKYYHELRISKIIESISSLMDVG